MALEILRVQIPEWLSRRGRRETDIAVWIPSRRLIGAVEFVEIDVWDLEKLVVYPGLDSCSGETAKCRICQYARDVTLKMLRNVSGPEGRGNFPEDMMASACAAKPPFMRFVLRSPLMGYGVNGAPSSRSIPIKTGTLAIGAEPSSVSRSVVRYVPSFVRTFTCAARFASSLTGRARRHSSCAFLSPLLVQFAS